LPSMEEMDFDKTGPPKAEKVKNEMRPSSPNLYEFRMKN